MKKLLLITLVILLYADATDAQWYYRQCGVANINECTAMEYECLMNKATKLSKTGKIGTGVSVLLIAAAAGVGVYIGETTEDELEAIILILALEATVGVIASVGILTYVPHWIIGAVRVNQVKKTPYHKSITPQSLKISPAIQINHFNSSPCLGMSLSLTF